MFINEFIQNIRIWWERIRAMFNIKKYSSYEILIIAISLFSFSTITQRLYPISINRVIVFLMSILLCIKKTYSKKNLAVFLLIMILFVYSCTVSNDVIRNITDFAYYFFSVLILLEFCNTKEKYGLKEAYLNKSYIVDKITLVNFLIILIEAVTPSCYYNEWGGRYFCGLSDAGHTIAPGICLNMALMLLYLDKKKFKVKNLIILCTYLVIVFNTGARIFVLPSVILVSYYFLSKINQKKDKIICSIVATIIFVFIFLKTGMYDKFMYSITGSSKNNMSFLRFFTSGRSVFWVVDLKDYMHSSIIEKLFGHGFDYIYQLNSSKVGMAIWAHNDFINILIGVGLFGFLIYIYIYICFGKIFLQYKTIIIKEGLRSGYMLCSYSSFVKWFLHLCSLYV